MRDTRGITRNYFSKAVRTYGDHSSRTYGDYSRMSPVLEIIDSLTDNEIVADTDSLTENEVLKEKVTVPINNSYESTLYNYKDE